MPIGQIGPLTGLVASIAAVVGAGMVLGGFATGLVGLVFAWSKDEFEERVLRNGYIGGLIAAGSIPADIMFRYLG